MDSKSQPAIDAGGSGAPAALERERSVESDLEYVSLQVDGATYGGWYRLLPDGQMELLALANMRRERRVEHTPLEQARGMLADFICDASTKDRRYGSNAAADEHP